MAPNSLPGFFPGPAEKQQDDDGSVKYANTDDGWTSDGDSDAGESPAAISAESESPQAPFTNLIDFSDSGDAHPQANFVDNALHNQTANQDLLDVPDMILTPSPFVCPSMNSNLNPESPPFSPSRDSERRSQESPSSISSYADARQSLDSRDDEIASYKARVKDLEDGHETLKRANDNLDTVNEMMKHRLEDYESRFEKLTDKLSEAEHLRTRAQKTAVDLVEKNEQLISSVDQLQKDRDEYEPQIAEYKNKLLGALRSNHPLAISLHDMQARLLNAVHHIKEIESFARSFLSEHPEHASSFASVGLFPPGEGQQYDSSGQIEAEALISFDEPLLDLETLPQSQTTPAVDDTPAKEEVSSPQIFQGALNSPEDVLPVRHDTISQPPTDQQHDAVAPSSHGAALEGLNWTRASGCIWESEFERERAIRSHQGPRPVGRVPGMFIHGIRFVRQHTKQKLTTEGEDTPDVASRRVIMSDIPDNVHIQRVLEHVRGGRILKANIVMVQHDGGRRNMAYIEFADAGDAVEFYRFTRRREFGFFVDDRAVRAHMELPATDSFPLSESLQSKLSDGCTRCLFVTDFPVVHLHVVLEFAGVSRNYVDAITQFGPREDGGFEISFADIQTAITVRDCILRSKFYAGDRSGQGVLFLPDPCDGPLDGLQVPFLPIESTSDVSILDPENARRFMTDEERALDSERLLEELAAAADPDDPDTFHPEDLRKNIVWEGKTYWDDIPTYMAYDSTQRRQVPHQRDPASGAVRMQYSGGWYLSPEESRKMWLHYNHDSPHPWTQKTMDLMYAATGEIDIRKIVVDDGGLDGDADQAMSIAYHGSQAPDERASPGDSTLSAPFLSGASKSSVAFDGPFERVPTDSYVNTIGCNPGTPITSLQEHDFLTEGATLSAQPAPQKRCLGNFFLSPSAPAVGQEVGVGVHGITKPGFNTLARMVKSRNQVASQQSKEPFPFW